MPASDIPTPADVEQRRAAIIDDLVSLTLATASEVLRSTIRYPASVVVQGYPVEVVGLAIAELNAAGWSVEFRPGNNMMMISPAVTK